MTRACCPTCHRPLPTVRCGVVLPYLKSRIFDVIKSAGPDGIEAAAIVQRLPVSRASLKSHVWQINERLADAGYLIVGSGPAPLTYRLTRFVASEAAE